MLEQVQFDINVPQELAFRYAEPKPCKNGSFMWSTDDGRVIFLEPTDSRKLQELGVPAGEPVQVTLGCQMNGNRIGKKEYRFSKLDGQDRSPQAAKPQGEPSRPQSPAGDQVQRSTAVPAPNYNPGGGCRPQTKLEDALKTVIKAVHESRQYAKEIGFEMPVFTAEDLRTMANTIMIEGRNGGLR